MISIDMHVHSTYSDGLSCVEEIASAARKRGLSLLALTDHDTVAGAKPFLRACKERGLCGLSGIELAAEAPFTLHILGYRMDCENAELLGRLEELQKFRGRRNGMICEKLKALGFDVNIEEVEEMAGGEVVARPHIAAVMRRKGYVATNQEAFGKYIGAQGSAYVKRSILQAEECISLIRRAGGLAVLAHPLQTGLAPEEFKKLAARLKDAGLWGMESIYPGHTPAQIYELITIANEYGLYSTAGTDFHGSPAQCSGLGADVSEDFLPWARLGVSL